MRFLCLFLFLYKKKNCKVKGLLYCMKLQFNTPQLDEIPLALAFLPALVKTNVHFVHTYVSTL